MIVCDGTADADERLKRVLNNDPGLGVLRHADVDLRLAVELTKGISHLEKLSQRKQSMIYRYALDIWDC